MSEGSYQLCLQREFEARHHLVGGDWGAENEPHSHHYRVELRLHGEALDQHEYLVDLVHVEQVLEAEVERYRGRSLNEQKPFAGRNPSVEWFARVLALGLAEGLEAQAVTRLEVRLWENEQAWASFSTEL